MKIVNNIKRKPTLHGIPQFGNIADFRDICKPALLQKKVLRKCPLKSWLAISNISFLIQKNYESKIPSKRAVLLRCMMHNL